MPVSNRESDDDYSAIVVIIDENHRVISCPHGIQWIVQTRDGRKPSGAQRWTGRSYCATRDGLLEVYRRLHPIEDPKVRAVLSNLPPHCPRNGGSK